jgi:hypothetical protein
VFQKCTLKWYLLELVLSVSRKNNSEFAYFQTSFLKLE